MNIWLLHDGVRVNVNPERSPFLSEFLVDGDDGDVPLPPIPFFSRVVAFLNCTDPLPLVTAPITTSSMSDLVSPSYEEIVNVDVPTLYALFEAANFLDIPALRSLCCWKLCTLLRYKAPLDMQTIACLTNLHPPEHHVDVVADLAWVFSL
jgi:hypothetical protein